MSEEELNDYSKKAKIAFALNKAREFYILDVVPKIPKNYIPNKKICNSCEGQGKTYSNTERPDGRIWIAWIDCIMCQGKGYINVQA